MYLPEAFRVDDPEVLHRLLRERPLGTLISAGATGLQASPLPWLLEPDAGSTGVLSGHMARANPHLADLRSGVECLVMFHGPQGYVSPSWYPSKQRHHQVVPTWNYAVVQVRGPARVIDDAAWLREHVARLTASREQRRAAPWSPDDAPAAFVSRMLEAIAGVQVEIEAIDGKFKFSQNREAADRQAVLSALADPDDPHSNPELAQWMRAIIAPG